MSARNDNRQAPARVRTELGLGSPAIGIEPGVTCPDDLPPNRFQELVVTPGFLEEARRLGVEGVRQERARKATSAAQPEEAGPSNDVASGAEARIPSPWATLVTRGPGKRLLLRRGVWVLAGSLALGIAGLVLSRLLSEDPRGASVPISSPSSPVASAPGPRPSAGVLPVEVAASAIEIGPPVPASDPGARPAVSARPRAATKPKPSSSPRATAPQGRGNDPIFPNPMF